MCRSSDDEASSQARINAALGERLRTRRRELGLRAESVAAAVGVGPAAVYSYETGDAAMSPSRLLALSRVLGVPASYFFDGLGEMEAPQPGACREIDDTVLHAARYLRRIHDSGVRQAALNLLRALAEP
jgi:transcriptional regulator with XRE-family HTH domain